MNPERIEKGDIVNITLTGSWIPKAEVLCVPNGDGVWGVKNQDKSYIFGVLKRCIACRKKLPSLNLSYLGRPFAKQKAQRVYERQGCFNK